MGSVCFINLISPIIYPGAEAPPGGELPKMYTRDITVYIFTVYFMRNTCTDVKVWAFYKLLIFCKFHTQNGVKTFAYPNILLMREIRGEMSRLV